MKRATPTPRLAWPVLRVDVPSVWATLAALAYVIAFGQMEHR